MASPGLKTAVMLSLFTLLTACGEKKAPEEYLPRVFVQEVKPTDYAASVTLTGDVQARVQTELSFRVGGKIIQRMVDVGDRVTAKQVLAKLDPKDLQTNVDSAQAQVVAEQARVKQSAAAFVRQQKLLPKGYTSQSEYDSAQAALRSSQSALTNRPRDTKRAISSIPDSMCFLPFCSHFGADRVPSTGESHEHIPNR